MRCHAACLLLAISVLPAARAAEPSPADETLLRNQGGLATLDGPAVLAYFKALTPGDKALADLETLVRNLSDRSYRVRRRAVQALIVVGPPARAALLEASRSKDLDLSRLAKECLDKLESRSKPELIAAAARVLAARQPDGATQTLLDYLPFAEDEHLAEVVIRAVAESSVKDGKLDAAIGKALADKIPLRRAAAAEALLRHAKPESRAAVRKLLKDGSPLVRARVALALVELQERESVAVLIDLIPEAPRESLWQIEQVLLSLGGEKGPKGLEGNAAADRLAFQQAWQQWWRDNGEKADLAALKDANRDRGLTLIVSMDQRMAGGPAAGRVLAGRVFEVDRAGKVKWEIADLNYPLDAQVVGNDRVLVAEYRTRTITERTFKGEVVWQKELAVLPTGVQRLPGGNTLIVHRQGVLEIDKEGKEVMQIGIGPPAAGGVVRGGLVTAARRARNGDTIVLERNLLVRYDAKGAEIKRVQVNVNFAAVIGTQVDLTPAGNVVVPLYNQNKVVELDADGKEVWSAACERPTSASRLPNGNTLVASRYTKLAVELDRKGKKVWEYACPSGAVLGARRR